MNEPIDFRESLSSRRIFVTGHTGFKGSWLCAWLERMGAEVTGYALTPAREPSLFESLGLGRRMRHIGGDVRDLERLTAAVCDARPEVVIHMAAQSLVRPSYRDPKVTFDINVGGTINILEAVRAYGEARVFVNVTSDKCYENREWVWGYRESDPMGGHDPYSASKGCSELVSAAYQRSFFPPERWSEHGLAMASVRAGNVIGGGDWAADRIVPDCVRAWVEGRSPTIRNPHTIRPWQHVLEPLAGYLILVAHLLVDPEGKVGAWNFGPLPDGCRTVGEVVTELAEAWGDCHWDDLSDRQGSAPHEARFLRLCCDKAMSLLNWCPAWDFDATIAQTVEWYRRFYADPRSASELCRRQIEAYEAQSPCLSRGVVARSQSLSRYRPLTRFRGVSG